MKKKSLKKVLAFIITVMVFSALPQLVSAQKNKTCPPGYKLRCTNRPLWCWCVPNGNGNNIAYSTTSQQLVTTSLALEHLSIVSLKIYDATGRLVKTIANGKMPQGYHQIEWDSKDDNGKELPAGVYVLQAATHGKSEIMKLSIIK